MRNRDVLMLLQQYKKNKNYILNLFFIIFRNLYIKYEEFRIFIINKQQIFVNVLQSQTNYI